MAADRLTRMELNRATLARQMLLAREDIGVTEAVERLAGMQAQEPKPPFIGLWSRIDGFRPEALAGALHARDVVRVTMMRGTLHLMSATDYAALRGAQQPVLTKGMDLLGKRAEGLDVGAVLPAARKLLAKEPIPFDEIRARLAERFPEVNDRALGFAVRMHLPLVMVPTGDRWAFPRNAAFGLADGWLGAKLPEAADTPALARRYLAAFGPASATDMQAWSGLGGLKPVLDELRPELRVFQDERGRELFDLPDAPRPAGDVPAPPRFLPEFDNLVLAHKDRSRVLPEEHRKSLTTKNLRVRATFLWEGLVRGSWETDRKRKAATLRMIPWEKLPKRAITELRPEAEALLRFLEPDAETHAVEVAA